MHGRLVVAAIGTVVGLLAAVPPTGAAGTATSAAARVNGTLQAAWEMDEPRGATVMTDSTGNGLNGSIVSSPEITTGFVFDGAVGYHWLRRNPADPPAIPSRVIQVPDDNRLEPSTGTGSFTIELRYRTKEKFGNITQKGQATTAGGQWKIQNPGGQPSCLFRGSQRRVATRVPAPINDNRWHVLTCVWTPSSVTALVDGVQVSRQQGSTGPMDNKYPVTIGGKINCDQVQVTCDYFSGEIDYLRLYKS